MSLGINNFLVSCRVFLQSMFNLLICLSGHFCLIINIKNLKKCLPLEVEPKRDFTKKNSRKTRSFNGY